MPQLSAAPRFACWFAAYTTGRTSLDEALDAITADDTAHHLVGLGGVVGVGGVGGVGGRGWTDATDVTDDESATPLVLGLGRLRASAVDHVALALPAPGDPAGLAGPPAFNAEAVEAGAAVLLGGSGIGLVPAAVGSGVFWRVAPAIAPVPPDLGEADRALRTALRETADALADLDVARWHPEVADALLNLRRPADLDLPPGTDPRAVALATTAVRCRAIVDLALHTDGATVTAYEADTRTTALRPLDRAARRGLAAACSSPVPR